MKKLILGIMAVVIMILLNNCGGGDNIENVDKKIYEKYIELKSDKNTTFILKGKENDALTLMIPSEDENILPQKSRQFKKKSNSFQNSQPHAIISTDF